MIDKEKEQKVRFYLSDTVKLTREIFNSCLKREDLERS